MKKKTYGFGYSPEETKQHFLVVIPTSAKKKILVFERFTWDDKEEQTSEMDIGKNNCRLKISLSYEKWKKVQPILEKEFNKTLKNQNKLVGKFKEGQTPIERLLGKEMMLLLWGIEKCDIKCVETAARNWLGFSREERWWMFTMTNANTGTYLDGNTGWRVAVRYALAENPIEENIVQGNLAEYAYSLIR